MHYSTAVEGLSIGGAVLVLPHLIIGAASLRAGLAGKPFLGGLSGAAGRIAHVLFGLLFAGVAAYSILSNIYKTHLCRTAVRTGNFVIVKGPVELLQRFSKPGYGYAEFKIGERAFRTNEAGITCDCGYITPIGKLVHIQSGMQAEAKIANGFIVELEIPAARPK